MFALFSPQVWVDAISSGGVVLASWVGRQGSLEVRRTVMFGERDVTIYMHTAIMNIGAAKLFDVRYLRSVDPDQEQPWNSDANSYVTNNYVKYQYQASYAGANRFKCSPSCSPCASITDTLALPSTISTFAENLFLLSVLLCGLQRTSRTVRTPRSPSRRKWLLKARCSRIW